MKKITEEQKKRLRKQRIPVSVKPTMVIRPKKGKGSYDRRRWKNDTRKTG